MSQQQEELTPWLLKLLSPYSHIFDTLYGLRFNLADIIIFKQGEPKSWFYQDEKSNIRLREEEWLKWRTIAHYLKNVHVSKKQIQELIASDNFDMPDQPPPNKFSFFYEQKYNQGKVYRPVHYETAQELFKNPNEKNEILSNWLKIVSNKDIDRQKQLFIITYDRESPGEQPRYLFNRKRISKRFLTKEEFVKAENNQVKKVQQVQEELDKSVAAKQNAVCETFVKSICRFLEGKLKKVISRLEIEFFMTDGDFEIFFTGLESLFVFNNESVPEPLDVLSVFVEPDKIDNFDKCNGIYCYYSQNNIYFDENDEQFTLYIMGNEKPTHKKIVFKSIMLDLIERYKTIEKVKLLAPERLKDGMLPEQLLFKLRTFYSLGDVTNSPAFRYLKISNFYKEQAVCHFCYQVYQKLDCMRQKWFQQTNFKRMRMDDQILADIEKFFGQSSQMKTCADKLGQQKFQERLQAFDNEQKKFFEEFQVTRRVDEKFFIRKKAKKDLYSSTKGFQLPEVIKIEVRNKSNRIKRVKYVVPQDKVEALGLKHYLGHAKNLPYSDQGLAISKSSLELNKLQDKIRDIQRIKKRMEQEKIKQVREDIEMMMCTYYGKGKQEQDRLIDYIETLKRRNEIEERNEQDEGGEELPQIQIVTDKNDFLTENQRRIKQDKEKQEQEILQTKKDFLEFNSDLAQSVQRRPIEKFQSQFSQFSQYQHHHSDRNSDY